MENPSGTFVISLDFELHWGIFDVKSVDDYKLNLENTRKAIRGILELSDKYKIRLTFSTVGFLFAENKDELTHFAPKVKPRYTNQNLNPYPLISSIGKDEIDAPYHFAKKEIEQIAKNPNHEIGTHTFSHYYCCAEGQTLEQFDNDINAAVKIAEAMGISINSIVFPRNQVKDDYLRTCFKNGITSYRGTEEAGVYQPRKSMPRIMEKGLRLMDSYVNVFGYHTYPLGTLQLSRSKNGECLNIPSSRFLRPYSKTLKILEKLKILRIKKAMTHAAKHGHLYHLWWHPHNFGANMKENLGNLEMIFKHFQKLEKDYSFTSNTMTSLKEQFD
ncbi:polysaccharide deacetylase family protein [Flagellimonas sp. 389]|uniref:polysaccharide deacetylase family protein n=1 Tax=Flagellimonas sp. 389 TaxID=2835862 RepID=UPI001BD23B31|nr:polysaccharide deacetylase family protein [Flagellimonas sp. 389]MBS9462204.1 polysaccharide deacetylase family protein [Flagellimonas sp. 389]